jgi:hypothetical protein
MPLPQQQLALVPVQLCCEPALPCPFDHLQSIVQQNHALFDLPCDLTCAGLEGDMMGRRIVTRETRCPAELVDKGIERTVLVVEIAQAEMRLGLELLHQCRRDARLANPRRAGRIAQRAAFSPRRQIWRGSSLGWVDELAKVPASEKG